MENPTIQLLPNISGRFESRWSRLKIKSTDSIFFKSMGESILGCWVAHGEGMTLCILLLRVSDGFPFKLVQSEKYLIIITVQGRFDYKTDSVKEKIFNENLVAVEYVDPKGKATTQYPYNPNGSEGSFFANNL